MRSPRAMAGMYVSVTVCEKTPRGMNSKMRGVFMSNQFSCSDAFMLNFISCSDAFMLFLSRASLPFFIRALFIFLSGAGRTAGLIRRGEAAEAVDESAAHADDAVAPALLVEAQSAA